MFMFYELEDETNLFKFSRVYCQGAAPTTIMLPGLFLISNQFLPLPPQRILHLRSSTFGKQNALVGAGPHRHYPQKDDWPICDGVDRP